MNDEIKEILDRIETASEIFDCLLKPEECTELLDYITNLQQENETLHENNQNMQEEMARVWEENERLKGITYNPEETNNRWVEEESELRKVYRERDDYKSRCEKAIEYIKEMLYPIGSCVNGSDLPYESIESLLNILQNGSDDK